MKQIYIAGNIGQDGYYGLFVQPVLAVEADSLEQARAMAARLAPGCEVWDTAIPVRAELPCPFCNGSGPGDTGVEGCTTCGGTNRVPA